MEPDMDFFDKLYAAYERAFVQHDDSWLTPSQWPVAVVLIVGALIAHQLAERWHERRLTNANPALTDAQLVQARRWFGAGIWAAYLLVIVAYILAANWP